MPLLRSKSTDSHQSLETMDDSTVSLTRRSSAPGAARVVAVSVIVPTFNEAPNVSALVKRIELAVAGRNAEVIFVDDSTDDTGSVILEVAATASIPVRLIHRDHPVGGLSGAVVAGLRQ